MKELEDYHWFPAALRNFQTDFIGFVVVQFNAYDAFIGYLKSLWLPSFHAIDLCSGSGEPAISIYKKSKCFSLLTLSDKYPNMEYLHESKEGYEMKQVDVHDMQFKPGICYTMFNALHHFKDDEKKELIEKIKDARSAAFFVEILEPCVICFLKVLIMTSVGTLVLTPFIKPFSFSRLFFTYIIPINLITIMYDGIVSVFKSRSVKHYQKLFEESGDSVSVLRLKKNLNTLTVIQVLPQK